MADDTLTKLEKRLEHDPNQAFARDVLDAAAALDVASIPFQRLLGVIRDAGARLRDWRTAVNRRREEIISARRINEIPADILTIRQELLFDSDDRPRRIAANAATIFGRDPRWANRIAYNSLRERVVITDIPPWHPDYTPADMQLGDWTDQDSTRATIWLSREWDIDLPTGPMNEVIEAMAMKRIIDPVADYLNGLEHDGVSRIDTWLVDYMRAEDNPYIMAVGSRWLISAVARALLPGVKVDCVMVLEGSQGIGKSSALRSLCDDPAWFFDDDLEVGGKAAAESIVGKWIIELGELGVLNRAELNTLKSFVTRQVDTYRQSFGRRARDFPRRAVFAGSVDRGEYLRDDENRRWWPVKCVGDEPDFVRLNALAAIKDQLWAEAVMRFRRGDKWHVDTPELANMCRVEQESRLQHDPWEEEIGGWVSRAKPCEVARIGDRCVCFKCKGTTIAQILNACLKIEAGKQTKSDEMRVSSILRRAKWVRGKLTRRAGCRVYPYYPPVLTNLQEDN